MAATAEPAGGSPGAPASRPADPAAGRARVVMLSLACSALLLVVAGTVGLALSPGRSWLTLSHWEVALAAVAVTLVGARVVERRRRNPTGWLLLLVGVSAGATAFSAGLGSRSVAAAWVGQWAWWPGYSLMPLVLLVFPAGDLPSRRWRPVWWIAAAAMAVPMVLYAVAALWEPAGVTATDRALPEPARTLLAVADVSTAGALVGAVAGVAAVVRRWRRARGDERQQLKWLAAAGAVTVVAWLLEGFWRVPGARLVGMIALPVGISVAILRYRLYDIDSIISRSLVYAALTGIVIALYLLVTVVLGELLGRSDSWLASLVATGVVAVAFHPLRERLQRLVNRVLYGQRDEPYAVLAQLGERLTSTLEPAKVLPNLTATVAQALKLPYVAIELPRAADSAPDGAADGAVDRAADRAADEGAGAPWDGAELAASAGSPVGEELRLPLVYQGEPVGHLVVGPRSPGEVFSAADLRLLGDVARHAGVAVHAVRLTTDLQRSRERLVSAREEERRRLRRDLHDGLGPVLGGMVLQLGALKTLYERYPEEAAAVVDRLCHEAKRAVADIRRLVYELRPAQLDEMGLIGALREHAASLATATGYGEQARQAPLTVTVDAPEPLPELPAAVEVAAYRIATEALTNVARHAQASRCQVRLTVGEALELEVRDNGRGLPADYRPGVGTTSMRERAAELGGSCTIRCAAGPDAEGEDSPAAEGGDARCGTVVRASLPLPRGR